MKKRLTHMALAVFCITGALLMVFITGCNNTKEVNISQSGWDLENLSLLQLWYMIADTTNIQEQSAEIVSLQLHTDTANTVDSFYFVFCALDNDDQARRYITNISQESKITIRKYDTIEMEGNRRPCIIFTELDKIGLASLETGESGLSVHIEVHDESIGYTRENLDIYELENGELIPLDEIKFHSQTPWCTISVYQLDATSSTTQTTAPAPSSLDGRTQIWFLAEEINMAETVEYSVLTE